MVQGQHRACMPEYIGKSGDLVGCYRCLTYSQTTEYRATQLVSSIKFKLSHAIKLHKCLILTSGKSPSHQNLAKSFRVSICQRIKIFNIPPVERPPWISWSHAGGRSRDTADQMDLLNSLFEITTETSHIPNSTVFPNLPMKFRLKFFRASDVFILRFPLNLVSLHGRTAQGNVWFS